MFRTLGVQISVMDPATYSMGLEARRVTRIEGGKLSTLLDCGGGVLGPNAHNYDVTMTLLVELAGHASGGSVVRTTLDAYARPRSSAGEPLRCTSFGTLERRVMELIRMELSGAATPPTVARGRIPRTGDHLRIECLSSPGSQLHVAEGEFLGASGEDLLLGVGSSGTRISLRASDVGAVRVRESRSRVQVGGLVGALAVGVAGGLWGRHWYEPANQRDNLHYREGVFVTLGAVGGVVAGYLSGRILGSFIRTNDWVDAPADWTLRFTRMEPDGVSPASESDACSGN